MELVAEMVTLSRELELEPSIEEVIKCLNKLKSGKAAGSSGIVADRNANGRWWQKSYEVFWKGLG